MGFSLISFFFSLFSFFTVKSYLLFSPYSWSLTQVFQFYRQQLFWEVCKCPLTEGKTPRSCPGHEFTLGRRREEGTGLPGTRWQDICISQWCFQCFLSPSSGPFGHLGVGGYIMAVKINSGIQYGLPMDPKPAKSRPMSLPHFSFLPKPWQSLPSCATFTETFVDHKMSVPLLKWTPESCHWCPAYSRWKRGLRRDSFPQVLFFSFP